MLHIPPTRNGNVEHARVPQCQRARSLLLTGKTRRSRDCRIRALQELVDRLAAVLDFNLTELCGPNSRHLKVKEPSKCCFDPKRLLEKIVELYCNLVRTLAARSESSYAFDLHC